MNKFQHVGTLKYNKVFNTRGHTYLTCRLYYQRIIHKYTNVFLPCSFLSSFLKLRERERVIEVLRKGGEKNSLNVYLAFWLVSSENIFFNGLAGFYGARLDASAILVQSSISLLRPEFGIRSCVLSRRPLSSKLISLSLFPSTNKGATSALGFWPII